MPRYVLPPSMSADLSRSMTALMVPLAWGIVHELSIDGPLTTREVADRLEVQPITVLKRLEPLLDAGLLTTPTAPGQRQGRQVEYAVDHDAVDRAVNEWTAYLRGSSAQSSPQAASASPEAAGDGAGDAGAGDD